MSRFLSFSSKTRSRASFTFNLLQRCKPCKNHQFRTYTNSWRYSGKRREIEPGKTLEKEDSTSWSAYVVPAAVLGFAGIAAYIHFNDEKRAVPKGIMTLDGKCYIIGHFEYMTGSGQDCSCNTNLGPIIGGPFTLTNAYNQIVSEKNFRGNWVLLYFGYTSSPDVGPEQVQIMAKAIDIVSKQNLKVLPVFVTIDPRRDSPTHLRAYLKEFDSRIVGLTGPVAGIRQMAQQFRVFFKNVEEDGSDYLVESSHNMYLLNPKMEVVRCFGVQYNANEMSEAILEEVKRMSA